MSELVSLDEILEKKYEDKLFIDLMRETINGAINSNKFYKKIATELKFKPDDLNDITDLVNVPFIPSNYFKESNNLFRKLLKIPASSISHWNVSSCTTGDPSLVGVNIDDEQFLIEMSRKLYLDYIPRDWSKAYVLCFSISYKMLNRVVMRYTKIRPARSYPSNYYNVTKTMAKMEYLIKFSLLQALKSIILTRKLIGAFKIYSDFVIKQLSKNEKRDENSRMHIALGGSVQLLKNFFNQMREKGISFNLGTDFDVTTGGGGWSGHKAQMKTDPVNKEEYVEDIVELFGTKKTQIIDIYGFTECPIIFMAHWSEKYKDFIFHCPSYARILIRNSDTLEPVKVGEQGLLEVFTPFGNNASVNHAIIVDDLVEFISEKKCPECGRETPTFRILDRITNKDGIGCSSIISWV
ncbi:MAG: LuxE/PaaK family acyltransferase [Candidatus Helarchaeota archaeon]